MKKYRKHGQDPYPVVMVHGGPGAVGDMELVAKRSSDIGVIETLHRARTVDGQVGELKEALKEADSPAVLVGHSWGAWLVFIYASRYPGDVGKLVLVSAAPFQQKYVPGMKETLLQRMSQEERDRYHQLRGLMVEDDDEKWLREYGELVSRVSAYDMLEESGPDVEVLQDVNQSVWSEADRMRRTGELLGLAEKIACPVAAIHGDYDHHPYQGVKEPLSRELDDFRFILLEKCGHYPWKERDAREEFFRVLREEIDPGDER